VAEVDAPVIERLRRGDAGAFDEIYRAHTQGLYAFLARLTRRPAVAEELLQETWLRLATHARALPADVNLRAWLFTVARNLYRSHRRWRIVDLERLRLWRAAAVARAAGAPSPHDDAAGRETARRLEDALAALPIAEREMVLLVGVEGFGPSEAAAIAGIRPEAARQRLSRARARLARALEVSFVVRAVR
jgi:RNA polymerase sigma-70 factor (ECF subfamily)